MLVPERWSRQGFAGKTMVFSCILVISLKLRTKTGNMLVLNMMQRFVDLCLNLCWMINLHMQNPLVGELINQFLWPHPKSRPLSASAFGLGIKRTAPSPGSFSDAFRRLSLSRYGVAGGGCHTSGPFFALICWDALQTKNWDRFSVMYSPKSSGTILKRCNAM